MSLATKSAKQRKEKHDTDSAKQARQKTHGAAPKQNVDTRKESKETVKESRKTIKDSESTAEQVLRQNSDLLMEKEKEQIEIQKLQEENTKLKQSNEEYKSLKEELEKIKDLLAQKESEITQLKEDIHNLQKRSNGEVGGLENLNHCCDCLLQDRHDHLLSGAETTPEAMMQPDNISPEPFLLERDHTFQELRGKFVTLERGSSNASVASVLETKDISLELPDKIKCQSSLSSNCEQAEDIAKTYTEMKLQYDYIINHDLEESHNSRNRSTTSKTTVVDVNCKTDFQNEKKNTEDTERSDNRNQRNESGNDPGPSQVRKGDDNDEEEIKRILKAAPCTEFVQEDVSTEDKDKQNIEDVEVPVKELTEEKTKLLNRKEEEPQQEVQERRRILKADSCTDNLQKHAGTYEKYKRKIEELEVQVRELTEENNALLNRSSQAKREEERRILKAEPCTENPQKSRTDDKYRRTIQELEVRVKELKEEKNKLLDRLSEIGSMKLTDNNPNVTDLSDANRPTKLVEQLSELYDNEWTDAYLDLTKTQGKKVEFSVKLLLQILTETYDICLSSTKEKATNLRKALLSYTGLSAEDSSELELQEMEKKLSEYRTKKSQCNIARVEEEVKQKFLNRPDHFETDISSPLTLYIDACVRICWFMCIKDPPMLLDFGERDESTATNDNKPVISLFDRSKFVPYTKSGDYLEYVVWPAVYLHEDGPILGKGVAQGSHA